MPIRNDKPKSTIEQMAAKIVANLERAIEYNLRVIGEKCINEARSAGSYLDQTGNLRSSVGYVIVRDGEIISKSTFPVVKNGSEGSKEGLQYAKSLAAEAPKGYCLIVVAGMKYARYVEARGRNVLQTSEQLAQAEAEKLLRKLGIKK